MPVAGSSDASSDDAGGDPSVMALVGNACCQVEKLGSGSPPSVLVLVHGFDELVQSARAGLAALVACW